MVRAAAVRFVLAFLMGLLMAPYSGTPSPDAHAHTPEIRAGSPSKTPADNSRGEYVTCGTPDRGGESNGLLRHRDRHRSATAPSPEVPSRSVVTGAAGGMLPTAAVTAMGSAHHTSRSSTAHSSPVLQVFRC